MHYILRTHTDNTPLKIILAAIIIGITRGSRDNKLYRLDFNCTKKADFMDPFEQSLTPRLLYVIGESAPPSRRALEWVSTLFIFFFFFHVKYTPSLEFEKKMLM